MHALFLLRTKSHFTVPMQGEYALQIPWKGGTIHKGLQGPHNGWSPMACNYITKSADKPNLEGHGL